MSKDIKIERVVGIVVEGDGAFEFVTCPYCDKKSSLEDLKHTVIKESKRLLICCKDCGEYFIGRVNRWVMYSCPNKCSSVDLEEHYGRFIGNVEFIRNLRVKEE